MRTLTMNPNVRASSYTAAAKLRAEKFLRIAAVVSIAPIMNYLLWGRVDGDERTPLGSVKVGTSRGRTAYYDLAALTGITRGARSTGLLALLEGRRAGARPGEILDRGVRDVVQSALHPAEGPFVQFAHTAVTGENMIGMHIAERARNRESQFAKNLQAALLNANPIVATATGANLSESARRRRREPGEVIGGLVGPYGIKYRSRPPGQPY